MPRIQIRNILCPVDLSEHSRHALRHAMALARWYGSRVTALEVLWEALPPVPFDPMSPPSRTEQTDAMREALQLFADAAAGPGAPVTARLVQGPVVMRIVQEAREWPADLIAMGTHGASGFERFILGSIAEKVLRKAPCPVLTVPPGEPEATPPKALFKAVLCAIDFSPSSRAGLRYAMSLAEEAGGRLIVMYALDRPAERPAAGDLGLDVASFHRRLEEEARRQLSAAITAEARTWCETTEVVAEGKPHEAILRVAEQQGADAIVMGVHGRTAVDLAFFGSTASQVVRAATCPVLTIRA